MLAALYGPLGVQPNTPSDLLLSYRQFRLMARGYEMKHRATWDLMRSAMWAPEGTDYDSAFGAPRSARNQSREAFDNNTDRIASENPDWFDGLANYSLN